MTSLKIGSAVLEDSLAYMDEGFQESLDCLVTDEAEER